MDKLSIVKEAILNFYRLVEERTNISIKNYKNKLYVIGGAALLFYGIDTGRDYGTKEEDSDIDLMFYAKKKKHFNYFMNKADEVASNLNIDIIYKDFINANDYTYKGKSLLDEIIENFTEEIGTFNVINPYGMLLIKLSIRAPNIGGMREKDHYDVEKILTKYPNVLKKLEGIIQRYGLSDAVLEHEEWRKEMRIKKNN